MLMFAVGH